MPTAWRPAITGPLRFRDQKDYAEASRRLSDKDFLVAPWEEPSVAFGGHYNVMWPKNVYWSKVNRPRRSRRRRGRRAPSVHRKRPHLRKVYHAGNNAAKMQKILDAEGGYWYHAHPRDEVHRWIPRRHLGHAVSEERSLPRRCVQARHGPGQLRGHDVRVALLRRRGHDEQHERGPGHRAEVRDCRHRHVPEEP